MWNMEAESDQYMNTEGNKGFSLVEVLVALAVASILLAGISSLIFTSLRLYGTNNANVEIQNESQRVLNLVLDNIMEARGVCMRIPSGADTDTNTECILLGDFKVEPVDDEFQAVFDGAALVFIGEPVNEMYLVDLKDAGYSNIAGGYCVLAEEQSSKEEAASAGLEAARNYVFGMAEGDRLPWLMGDFVDSCVIVPANGLEDLPVESVTYLNGDVENMYYFREPFTLHVNLGFAFTQQNRIITRTVEDDIAVRSRLKTIYVDEVSRGMQEYRRW